MSLETKIQKIIDGAQADVGVAISHIERDEEIAINGDQLYPLCSVLKIPVLVEAFRQIDAGLFTLDDRWELTTAEKNLPSGILVFMEDGLTPTVRDLLTLMIIISDNTATDMLMNRLGVERINQTLRDYDLDDIHVPLTIRKIFESILPSADPTQDLYALAAREDKTPVDDDPVALRSTPENDTATARDMNRLLKLIFNGEIVGREACDGMLEILLKQQLNDRLPRLLPPGTRCAHKTGTLSGFRNDSGIIYVGEDNHVAVTAFIKWDADAPGNDPAAQRKRMFDLDEVIGQIGLAAYEHYAA